MNFSVTRSTRYVALSDAFPGQQGGKTGLEEGVTAQPSTRPKKAILSPVKARFSCHELDSGVDQRRPSKNGDRL